jgi:guanylate kinase
MSAGSDQTRLTVLRGSSGSGKTTVAAALREAYGTAPRGSAAG